MSKNFELMISYGNDSWAYFKTDKDTAKLAYKEYVTVCEEAGINIDNMNPSKIVLRDKNYVDIDSLEC